MVYVMQSVHDNMSAFVVSLPLVIASAHDNYEPTNRAFSSSIVSW